MLRFNDVTRQTVMRCTVTPGGGGSGSGSSSGSGSGSKALQIAAQPDCLAQEYLKTTASVAAALLGLQRLLPVQGQRAGERSQGAAQKQQQQQQQQPSPPQGEQRLRVLCIGVGGGSLPLFLAHHFPRMGALLLFCGTAAHCLAVPLPWLWLDYGLGLPLQSNTSIYPCWRLSLAAPFRRLDAAQLDPTALRQLYLRPTACSA